MSIRPYTGKHPEIHDSAYIDNAAVVIGDVTIAEEASIWPMAVLRGDVHHIEIGQRTNVQDGAVLHVTHDGPFSPGGRPLVIGDDVTVGHNATLHACTVGNGCLIGMNAVVLDGAVIEDGAMVGAGALVTPGTVVTAGTLWVGSPAKQARPLKDKEKEFLPYSAQHYLRLAQKHRESQIDNA